MYWYMVHAIYFFIIEYKNLSFLFLKLIISFRIQCPLPPVTIKINVVEFCREAKKHVDCVNKRLENCSQVQEYGPALGRFTISFRYKSNNVSNC